MKQWLLNLSFIQSALKEAERQGGIKAFPLAQKDILETMRDDLEKKAEEIAKKKLNDLLSPVDLTKIITFDERTKRIFIGGEVADDARLANLKAEAQFLMESELWKLLQESPKALAERAMFVAGESLDDMKKGRSILYVLSTQQKIVDKLR